MLRDASDHFCYSTLTFFTASTQPNLSNNANAKLANPLAGLSKEELIRGASEFCDSHDLQEYKEDMIKGALVAQVSSSALMCSWGMGFDERERPQRAKVEGKKQMKRA